MNIWLYSPDLIPHNLLKLNVLIMLELYIAVWMKSGPAVFKYKQ